VYFNVNCYVFFKLIKVPLLVSEVYRNDIVLHSNIKGILLLRIANIDIDHRG